MAVEIARYISELEPNNPQGNESISEGDDHIRVTKYAVQQSFPNVSGPVDWTPADFVKVKDYVDNPPEIPEIPETQAASVMWDGTQMKYENNVSKVTSAGPSLNDPNGVRVTFKNLIQGFDEHYAVAIQMYATNGKHVIATVTNQQPNFVEFAVLEFDGPSQTWGQPAGGAISCGFTFMMVDAEQA